MKKQLPSLAEQFLTRNWLYKLIALTVALAIWTTTLQGRKDALYTRTMEIEFMLRADMAITSFYERKVVVKVGGPQAALKKFAQSPHVIAANLAQAEAGRHRFSVRAQDMNLPAGVKLIGVQPEVFELDIKEVKKP